MRHTYRGGSAAVAVLLTAALAGCGSDTLDPGGSPSASSQTSVPVTVVKDDALAALVPDDVRKAGTLTVGTDASYAPNEFTVNGNQIKGMDIDLLSAVASKLGLKLTFQNGNFDSLVGGVASSKYALGVSSFTINSDRLKQITMVQYFSAGTAWAVSKNSSKKVDPNDACGLTVGVQKGTVQVDDLTARSKKCTAAGKPAITQIVEDAQAKVTADLIAGKVDAMAADSPVANWAVAQNAQSLEKVGTMYDAAPYGIAFAKNDTKFAEAVSKALEALAKDGSYKKILANWSNTEGAVSQFPVNPQVG